MPVGTIVSREAKVSYLVFFGVLISVALLHLATPFLVILFASLILRLLRVLKKKWISITVFVLLVCGIFYGFGYFLKHAVTTLPHIASTSIPIVINYAKEKNLELPFADWDGLKALVVDGIYRELGDFAKVAQIATKEFVFLVISLVIAIGIFVDSRLNLDPVSGKSVNSLFAHICREITLRFHTFYKSFETVMGAQMIISAINTFFTGIFVYAIGLPFPTLIVVITFLCGLLPIIGNIISNTIIFFFAITVSLEKAVFSLLYLIVIHKLEYFLNSRIVGGRIRSPMWLTLSGLVIGERALGVPGMIFAPVVLHYLRIELSRVELRDDGIHSL